MASHEDVPMQCLLAASRWQLSADDARCHRYRTIACHADMLFVLLVELYRKLHASYSIGRHMKPCRLSLPRSR